MGTAKMAVRGAFTAPMEASMEAGSTERRLLEQGVDPETARQQAWGVFGKNVGLLTASNALQFGLFNKILNGAGLKSRSVSALANAGIQGGEEAAQQGFQNLAEGKPFTENAGQAALEGILPIAVTGALGIPFGSAKNALLGKNKNKNNNPQPAENEEPTIQTSSGNSLVDWVYSTPVYNDNDFVSKGKDETINKVIAAAQRNGVDPKLALAVAMHESHLNQNEGSDAGAKGVMQLMPATARSLGVDINNEDQNIEGGVRYLKQMLDRFNGDVTKAVAAYNAGPGAVEKYGGIPPYSETQRYTNSILKAYGVNEPQTQNQTQNTQQQGSAVTISDGLKSARKSLNGVKMDNGTVGCVEAVTKILSHFHPEFKKMVDDGVVNTVEGENSLKSRLEKLGIEIIPFDEAKVAEGDIIFYDGKQTDQHVLVADHKDANGNWKVFGNSSSANKVMEQPLYQGQKPARIAKISNFAKLNSSVTTTENTTETDGEETQIERDTSNDELIKSLLEPTQTPNFELDDDNAINQDFFKNLVDDKLKNGTADEIAKLGKILESFYNDKGEFQNTKENRKALANALGEDNLKNLGQQNLNSKIADYKNFLQTQLNPLQKEIDALTEKHDNAKADYEFFRTAEGLQGSGHGKILKRAKQSIIDTKQELDDKISQLEGIQKILNPEPVETKPVEQFTATLNQNAKAKPTDKNLLSMLELDEAPTFNPLDKNSVARNIVENFIKQKISSTQDKSLRSF